MPTPTYDLIASNVLGSSASSVTFSSIPATYRDLIIITDFRSPGETAVKLTFNSDSGSNYSWVLANGDGSSATSSSSSSQTSIDIAASLTGRGIRVIQIMDYSATDKHKTVLVRADNAADFTRMIAGRWASTAAINSVTLATSGTNFSANGTFYLYGIVS